MADIEAEIAALRKKLGNLDEDAGLWKSHRSEVEAFLRSVSPVGKLEPKSRDAIRGFLDGLTTQLHLAREDMEAWEVFNWYQNTANPEIQFVHGDPRYPWDDTREERQLREPVFYWLAARVAYCAGKNEVAIAACGRAWRGTPVLLDIFDIAILALWESNRRKTAEDMFEKAHGSLMGARDLERAASLESLWNSLDGHGLAVEESNKLNSKKRGNKLVRKSSGWEVTYGGKTEPVPALRGMDYLAVLLGNPGRAFRVLELSMTKGDVKACWIGMRSGQVEDEQADFSSPFNDLGNRFDAEGEDQISATLEQKRKAEREAGSRGDKVDQGKLKSEISGIERELELSTWKNEPRKEGDLVERIRSAVRQAIRKAIAKIEKVHPALGSHLKAVRTGSWCSYNVDPPIRWEVVPSVPGRKFHRRKT